MASTVGINALPVPTSTDTPDVPRDFTNLASKIDAGLLVICTSTTRPAAPVTGTNIFETDTGKEYVYLGGAWKLLVDSNVAANLANPPRCRATTLAAFSVPNNAYTLVPLESEDWDSTGTMHDTVTNNSRVVAQVAGLYMLTSTINYASNSTGQRYLHIRKNAAGNPAGGSGVAIQITSAGGASALGPGFAAEISMAAGDYVELFAFQNSGAALGLTTVGGPTFLSLRWVAAS